MAANDRVFTAASPSLALVKYWGKADTERNTPATTSIGITLAGLETRTAVSESEADDSVTIDGVRQPSSRFTAFFKNLRAGLGTETRFHVESYNTFPTAAGLASSSSGFAALALGCSLLVDTVEGNTDEDNSRHDAASRAVELHSALALRGSASAARALFEGFAILPAGAEHARQLYPANHWPDLRVLAVAITGKKKLVSSRAGMNLSRDTSPYYADWVAQSAAAAEAAQTAIHNRDLSSLGPVMRESYLRMVGTMISATPPFLYWLPESVTVIRVCETLRQDGIPAWETMDAGPQVKIVTTEDSMSTVRTAVLEAVPSARVFETRPGAGAREISESEFHGATS